MTPALFILLLFVAGVVLLVGELFLPAQGILGLLGCAAIVCGVGRAFMINQWLGLGLTAGVVAAIPFVWTTAMSVWPRTPIGRRIMLAPVQSPVQTPPVKIGQRGIAVSALRPSGLCEFAGERYEARCETDTIDSGKLVRVVNIDQGRLIVAPVEYPEQGVA